MESQSELRGGGWDLLPVEQTVARLVDELYGKFEVRVTASDA